MLNEKSFFLAAALIAGCSFELEPRDVCADGGCTTADMGSAVPDAAPDAGPTYGPVPTPGTIDSTDPKKTVDGKTGPRVYQVQVSQTQSRTFVCWPYHGGAETDCRWYEPRVPSDLPALIRTTNPALVGYDFNFQNASDAVILTTGYNSLPWYELGQAPAAAVSVQVGGNPSGVQYYILRAPTTLVPGMAFDLRVGCPLNTTTTGSQQGASCRFR